MATTRETHDLELDRLLQHLDSTAQFEIDRARMHGIAARAEVGNTPQIVLKGRAVAWVGAGTAAILAIGLASPAIADGIQQLTHTGRYGPETTESDGSEWMASTGSDYEEYLASVFPAWITVPSGISLDDFKSDAVARLATVEGEGQQVLFESTFENDARCMWAADWLKGDELENSTRAAGAAAVLHDSVNWPATVAVAAPEGGYLEYLESIAVAADNGTRADVSYFIEANCTGVPTEMVQ